MKVFKKMTIMFMAFLMLYSLTANAMAAEVGETMPTYEVVELVGTECDADGNEMAVYEFEVTPETIADGDYGIMPLSLDQSFTMGYTHRGGDRTYSGNKLRFSATVTDQNGNAVDNWVSVQLYDYNHTGALTGISVYANGGTTTSSEISITPGRVYYFKYTRTSGASRTLKVHMRITDYN